MNLRKKKDQYELNLIKGGSSFYLTLVICLIVFFGAIAMLISAFDNLISRHDQQLSGEICTIMSEKMNASIEFMTESAKSMTSVLSAQEIDSLDDIYSTLKAYKKGEYLSIGFVDSSGEIFATDEEKEEFEKWKLMNTAVHANPVSMSAPYRSSVYGQPVITMFADFEYGSYSRHGYMFITYLLKDLQEIAVTESLGDDVEIWLMDAESANIIQCAGSDEHSLGSWTNAYLSMQTIDKADVPTYSAWLDSVRQLNDNIGISYSINDVYYSQYCSKINSMPGWYVVVRIPSNTLSATMNTFRNYVLVFLAVLLIVVIVLIANMYRLNKRESKMLTSLSIHDPLTGALNRRAFDLAAEQLLSRGRDHALIFFDIDYFKQVNDRFGHDAGDRLLVSFSESLKNNFSKSGIISRFGGDEFVVLTEMNDQEVINGLLKKTTEEVHSFDLNDRDKDDREFIISFSAGAARYPADADNLSALKKCADTALYETKERGRNGYLWFTDVFSGTESEEIITVTDVIDEDTKVSEPSAEAPAGPDPLHAGEVKEPAKKVVRKVIRRKIVKKVVKRS
ncbi:MAG: sensor domain-containing diguanylate cyclase [Lachnospiraceae bacterium]|nr:sensor domain-containing diguanylate cyclase [Lachnospiraceae bacterium]